MKSKTKTRVVKRKWVCVMRRRGWLHYLADGEPVATIKRDTDGWWSMSVMVRPAGRASSLDDAKFIVETLIAKAAGM